MAVERRGIQNEVGSRLVVQVARSRSQRGEDQGPRPAKSTHGQRLGSHVLCGDVGKLLKPQGGAAVGASKDVRPNAQRGPVKLVSVEERGV